MAGDKFYSLKYRQWLTIDDIGSDGRVRVLASANCPKFWNIEGYLMDDDVYGYPDARWVEPDFKEAENVRPKRMCTCKAEGEAFVNIYPAGGKDNEYGESIHTEGGDILCLHHTWGRAKQVLGQGGKTYPARYIIIYKVEI